MSINIQNAAAMNEGVIVRSLIAEHLGVEPKRVSDQAHFFKDLGAGWLDRLDLIMALEDHFDIELDADDVVDIEVVGDLVRFIEGYWSLFPQNGPLVSIRQPTWRR